MQAKRTCQLFAAVALTMLMPSHGAAARQDTSIKDLARIASGMDEATALAAIKTLESTQRSEAIDTLIEIAGNSNPVISEEASAAVARAVARLMNELEEGLSSTTCKKTLDTYGPFLDWLRARTEVVEMGRYLGRVMRESEAPDDAVRVKLLEDLAKANRTSDLDPDEDELHLHCGTGADYAPQRAFAYAAKRNHRLMLELLERPGVSYKALLISTLADQKCEGIEPVLLRYAVDPHVALRMAAVSSMRQFHSPQAREALEKALQDRWQLVRREACEALQEHRSAESVDALYRAFVGPNKEFVRNAAVAALIAIGGAKAFDRVLDAMKSPDADIRNCACRALSEIDSGRALVPLLSALGDTDAEVRITAMWGLPEEPRSSTLDRLLLMAADPSPRVRECLCNLLSQREVRDPMAEKTLLKLLQDRDSAVREAAQEALEKLRPPRTAALK